MVITVLTLEDHLSIRDSSEPANPNCEHVVLVLTPEKPAERKETEKLSAGRLIIDYLFYLLFYQKSFVPAP